MDKIQSRPAPFFANRTTPVTPPARPGGGLLPLDHATTFPHLIREYLHRTREATLQDMIAAATMHMQRDNTSALKGPRLRRSLLSELVRADFTEGGQDFNEYLDQGAKVLYASKDGKDRKTFDVPVSITEQAWGLNYPSVTGRCSLAV